MKRHGKERKIRSIADRDRPKLNGDRERFKTDADYREEIYRKAKRMNIMNVIGSIVLLPLGLTPLFLLISGIKTFQLYYISDSFKHYERLISGTTLVCRVCCSLFELLLLCMPIIGWGLYLVMSLMAEAASALAAWVILYFIPATIVTKTQCEYAYQR